MEITHRLVQLNIINQQIKHGKKTQKAPINLFKLVDVDFEKDYEESIHAQKNGRHLQC